MAAGAAGDDFLAAGFAFDAGFGDCGFGVLVCAMVFSFTLSGVIYIVNPEPDEWFGSLVLQRNLRGFVPTHKAPLRRNIQYLSGVLVNYNSPSRSNTPP
ncbi:hypothetical protein [Allopontixanthobacter sediminis]|uniref:Uncharacterized protein n=1 Tax=Allopontixanthobacter sediminis TaxID=1689985 RepID=A0A845AXG8_9SPHN|nr:hypothetical protein [Allopontixanthobacter sediminis]MXP43701.1 hypothetical protein [Allopontixanthobacter sediminis]